MLSGTFAVYFVFLFVFLYFWPQVEKLFQRIGQEQSGRLDVLVNNAYAGVCTTFYISYSSPSTNQDI